ncbi:MAG TPA: helix-turn-helix domain-containing protein [Gemmatimonadaceae bacterium]
MPLNRMLGTEANVRVLRVLTDRAAPMSPSDVARHAELQRSSVHRALRGLEESAIVEYVGTGPHTHVALRARHPLANAIRTLFAQERLRYEKLIRGLKAAAAALEHPPMAVWLDDRLARGTDRAEQPIVVYVIDSSRALTRDAELLRRELAHLEKALDVQIDVQALSNADLDAGLGPSDSDLRNAVPLLGLPPDGILNARLPQPERRIRTHGDHDAAALDTGARIADAIKRDATIVDEARRYIDRRWKTASPGERKELAEWKQILRTATPAQLRRILIDPGPRATRLRQTLPFVGVLNKAMR